MIKYIGIVRTSTIKQDIEAQTLELKQFMLSDGCKEDEIKIVDGHGASAIKMDELFQENVEKVKSYIEKGGIECVYAWAIDRIGRNDEFLMGFKNYLIGKKVNLKIKEPRLELLTDKGEVDAGMELAFFLFTALAKQEMEGKKARFNRGKAYWAEQGKYMGGEYVRFGYYVDDNGFFQIDAEQAKVIELAFTMYASGEYSLSTLAKELDERGYKYVNSMYNLGNMFRERCYLGEPLKGKLKLKYPRIISDSLFDKVQQILTSNNTRADKQTKHHYYANKIYKCPCCGGNMTSDGKIYLCHKSAFAGGCKRVATAVDLTDGLLYQIAVYEHLLFLARNVELETERLKNELSIVQGKKINLEQSGAAIEAKIERAKNLYKKGLSTEQELDDDIRKIRLEDEGRKNRIKELEEEENSINEQINAIGDDSYDELLNLWDKVLDEKDEEKVSKMIKLHIKKLNVSGNRTEKIFKVELVRGGERIFKYLPFYHKGRRLYEIEAGEEKPYVEYYVQRKK